MVQGSNTRRVTLQNGTSADYSRLSFLVGQELLHRFHDVPLYGSISDGKEAHERILEDNKRRFQSMMERILSKPDVYHIQPYYVLVGNFSPKI